MLQLDQFSRFVHRKRETIRSVLSANDRLRSDPPMWM